MRLINKVWAATSKGCLSKNWYTDGVRVYLVKGNSNFNGVYGYEPISEAIAYKVALELGIECAPCILMPSGHFSELRTFNLGVVSVETLIQRNRDVQRLSAIELLKLIYGKEIYGDIWNLYTQIPFRDTDRFVKMLIFDAIIGNEDRHLDNWEIDVYPDGSMVHTPLYDNGASLLALVPRDELTLNFELGYDVSKPFSSTHNSQMRLVKRRYPNFVWDIGIDEVWYRIKRSIEPELRFLESIDELRCHCVCKYIHNRLYYYLGMFGGRCE